MTLFETLHIAAALAAPAFFLFFWLAALGAPVLAVICITAGQLRGTQHPEAYARRLLRMALACALPSLLLIAAGLGLALYRVTWLKDWLLASPLAPGLHAVALTAFCASLLMRRFTRPKHRSRLDNPLPQAAVLALIAVTILWLSLSLLRDLAAQAASVLNATADSGIALATLVAPGLAANSPLFWAAVLASALSACLCSGAWSLEYLLLRRDREPFGRDAFAHVMRLAARTSLRCGLLTLSFLPALWDRLTDLPGAPDDARAVTLLLLTCGGGILLACALWAVISRSNRPCARPWLIHAALSLIWLAITASASAALLHFYAG